MIIDPVREKRQKEIVRAWGKAGGKGTLEAATGFGKTHTAILATKVLREKYPPTDPTIYDVDVVVVSPRIHIQEKWAQDFREENIKGFQSWVVNSLIKRKVKCRLLIVDEIHMFTGEEFRKIFECVKYDFIFGLTATLPENDGRRDLVISYAPVIDTVTLKECLDNGWVSPFTIWNLGITLSDEEFEVYDKLNKTFAKSFGMFQGDFNLMKDCLKDAETRVKYANTLGWDVERVRLAAINGMRSMRKRHTFLWTCESKIQAAEELVEKFQEAKIITFSQSIEAVELMTERLGSIAIPYHSQLKGRKIGGVYLGADRIKNYHLSLFKTQSEGIRVLNTAMALDMGADFPFIDMAIVLSGSSKVIQALQRYGRTFRYVEGKWTRVIETYAIGTQDERALNERQAKTPIEAINWVTSIDQIM